MYTIIKINIICYCIVYSILYGIPTGTVVNIFKLIHLLLLFVTLLSYNHEYIYISNFKTQNEFYEIYVSFSIGTELLSSHWPFFYYLIKGSIKYEFIMQNRNELQQMFANSIFCS